MLQGYKLDANSFLSETVLTESEEEGVIYVEYQGGLYKPKWNGVAWVEGATAEEIASLNVVQPSPLEILQKENKDLKQSVAELTVLVTSMLGGGVK